MVVKLERLVKLKVSRKVGLVAKISRFKVWLGCLMVSTLSWGSEDIMTGHVGVLSNQINADVGDVPGNRYNANMSFDYYKNPEKKSENELEARFTFAGLVNDRSLFMYSVQESYIAGKLTPRNDLKAGRQILNWSTVDHTWGFGKLNNRRNFDFFEPGQEGLIGLNWEYTASTGLQFKLFASPLYIPEMNPAFDIDNSSGKIKSRHPWSDVPATTAEVSPGNVAPINYKVNYPDIADVVFRPAAGFNIGYQNDYFQMDNFFIRKPENQLTTKVDVSVDTINNVIKANITPEVYYHDVYGSTLKYKNQGLQMYASGIAIQPNDFPDGNAEATRYTTIKTEKRREAYMGGGISFKEEIYSYGFNYVARLSPFDRDKEELATDPRWNQALNFFGTWQATPKLSFIGDVKFDMLTSDRLIMLRGIYAVSKNFMATLGMNLIGTPEDGRSFWSTYTNNDSLFVGLRYVF